MRKPPQLHMKPQPTRRHQHGISLIDGLIAIAILSFGLIGLTRMQGRMVTAATDAQFRTTAVQFADEILNTALVDSDENAPCYTVPATGTCNVATAAASTAAWSARLADALPGTVEHTVDLGEAGPDLLRVRISWTPRDLLDDARRELTVITHVR